LLADANDEFLGNHKTDLNPNGHAIEANLPGLIQLTPGGMPGLHSVQAVETLGPGGAVSMRPSPEPCCLQGPMRSR
jgi:hypothetical protein